MFKNVQGIQFILLIAYRYFELIVFSLACCLLNLPNIIPLLVLLDV